MSSAGSASRGSGDRAIRNLMNLRSSASSSRTLNLLSVWEKDGKTDLYRAAPFFKNPVLNRSIILKHRLRNNEHDLLDDGRKSATKVILPINLADLRSGGRSFFIGQRNYDAILDDIANGDLPAQDRELLGLLDNLPSLDPFLMRERLKKSGIVPARCYFDISESDTARMFEFTRREIAPLIGMTLDDLDIGASDRSTKFANKILNNAGDAELEPLRQGMGMDKLAFEEGIFCWKGFIYYKWSLIDLAPMIKPVSEEISQVKPSGPMTADEKQFIVNSRNRLTKAIASTCETVRTTLKVYDDAYAEMTQAGKPLSFRDFLLEAPGLFYELGERLGALQHVVSFWRYRFPKGQRLKVPTEELYELLSDFEQSLDFKVEDRAAA